MDIGIGDITIKDLDHYKKNKLNVVTTVPVFYSTFAGLVSKKFNQQQGNDKITKCIEYNEDVIKNTNIQEFKCFGKLTLEDVMENKKFLKVVMKYSSVYHYLLNQKKLSEYVVYDHWHGMFDHDYERHVMNESYVFIDEQKFLENIANHRCDVDVIYPLKMHALENAGNAVDEINTEKIITFSNPVVIVMTQKFASTVSKEFNQTWLELFNRVISDLENSQQIKNMRNRYWRNNCLKDMFFNHKTKNYLSFFVTLYLIVCVSFFAYEI